MGQVENIYLRTRKKIATSIGRKTTHGMPSTEKHLDGIRKSDKLTESLYKGHLSEKHIACHKQKELPPPDQALKDVLESINKANAKLGYKLFSYSPGDMEKSPTKEQIKGLRHIVRGSASSFKSVFNNTSRMSPWIRRLVNGVIKLKQIRPMYILLAPKERTVIKHKISRTYKYKKVDFKKGQNKTNLKTQVVYPKY